VDDVTETMTAGSQMPDLQSSRNEQWVAEVEQIFRERDAGVFFVLPRVVRRVWQSEVDITSPWLPPPHRKSCVIDRDRLLWIVARDELGVDVDATLPQRLILIARPEEDRLQKFSREDLLRYYWRLLFHARIDFELESKSSPSRMTRAELRRRIDAIGHTQFDAIQSVLRTEQMLCRPEDPRHVYAEFVAVWHELHVFAPDLLPLYFPLLNETVALRAITADCNADSLLDATRPADIPAVASVVSVECLNDVTEVLLDGSQIPLGARSSRKYASLVRGANRFRQEGNNVRAALVRRKAFDVAPLNIMNAARNELLSEIERLVLRLQAALELSDVEVRPWLAMCERLLPAARRGFWNANARLLSDLQQVCLDHEQEIYKTDLLSWLKNLGRVSLKRPLPNQRIVMMSKHLRRAVLRVPVVQINATGRQELSRLLHAAADAAEHILRRRMEPLVREALRAAGFVPQGVVERVALQKVTQELLDGVVQRGFLTLGNLRDAISRNQLKMPDLNNVRELVTGDPLLRADKILSSPLEGVYQRGPFYLRWLQRASSLAYGTACGRVLTKFFFLPFGLSFLSLMAAEEIAHLVIGADRSAAHQFLIYSSTNMFWLGLFIFACIHLLSFRNVVILLLKATRKVLKLVLLDAPRRIVEFPLVEWVLKSFPMRLFRRFLLTPLLATSVLCLFLPFFGVYQRPDRWWSLVTALLTMIVLNSRIGRDTEELTREFVSHTWYRIRTHLLLGLFTFVVDAFQWLMDGLERVLYAVDEWLRFRSGESRITLGVKAVLGLAWSLIHGVIRFCVTLLIEPQINPIKHFPVVTVSHKLVMTTLLIPLATLLERFYDKPAAWTLAGLILSGIPGVFGFLAWELKENWKLYAANRHLTLRPVHIGHHGESLTRLLRPGFHSGTIPKMFARRRRAARNAHENPQVNNQARYAEKMHHEAESVRQFVDRELVGLLRESRTFRERSVSVTHVALATNRISIFLRDDNQPDEPTCIEISEQSGWLIAGVSHQGWLAGLTDEDRVVFRTGLAGLYKLGAVDLVKEHIETQLMTLPTLSLVPATSLEGSDRSLLMRAHPYDITLTGLIVWPQGNYESEIRYDLEETPTITPRPRSLARSAGLFPIPSATLKFSGNSLSWEDWQAYWETEQKLLSIPLRVLPEVMLIKTG